MSINKNKAAIQTLKDYAKKSGIFANLETIGSYDNFSQIVSIDYLDENKYKQLLQKFISHNTQQNYESLAQFYSTCVHEFTHWLDHTSTLWGQQQLLLIYNAINAGTNQDEQDFYKIAIANSERHRARLAIYYTEEYQVDQQETTITPWRYKYGSGLEFGIDGRPRADRPFVFTLFLNASDQRICRVPFSMFALTESNSTYAEFKVKNQSLALLDDDSRLVAQHHLKQELLKNLYNSKLAIYSIAAHCLANSIGLNEVFKAYEMSSALATLCLNLPRSLFYSLIVPDEFTVWGARIQALKKLADPGFAFFTIAQQAPKYYDGISTEQWLQAAIENAGLPKLDVISNLAYLEMEQLKDQITEGIYADKLKSLLTLGKNNFMQRGVWGKCVLSMENLLQTPMILPPIVLGDGFVTPVVPRTISTGQKDMEQWIDEIINLEVSLDQFIRGCRF